MPENSDPGRSGLDSGAVDLESGDGCCAGANVAQDEIRPSNTARKSHFRIDRDLLAANGTTWLRAFGVGTRQYIPLGKLTNRPL